MRRSLWPVVLAAIAGCTPARAERAADGEAILRTYCVRCHAGPEARGGFDFVANPQALIAKGFVVPGDAARSVVFERIAAGEMPPEAVALRPSAAEIAALRAWIDGMAPTAGFRRDDAIAGALAADAAAPPPVWIDRDRHTWVLLEATADQPAALGRCRARSLALPRADELVAAVAQGVTAGLAIAAPMWTAGTRLDVSNQRYAMTVEPSAGAPRRADVAERHVVVCVQR